MDAAAIGRNERYAERKRKAVELGLTYDEWMLLSKKEESEHLDKVTALKKEEAEQYAKDHNVPMPVDRAASKPEIVFFKKLISRFGWGTKRKKYKSDNICPLPFYSQLQQLAIRHGRSFGKQLSNSDLTNHTNKCGSDYIRYYTSSDDVNDVYALLCLDVDAHDNGSYEGTQAFARTMKAFFGNNWTEDSTSGGGTHIYILVQKLGKTPRQLRDIADKLKITINNYAKKINADITGVDVNGTAPIYEFINGELDFTLGRLMKVPSNLVAIYDLAKNNKAYSLKQLEEINNNISSSMPALPIAETTVPNNVAVKTKKKQFAGCGSTGPKWDAEGLMPSFGNFLASAKNVLAKMEKFTFPLQNKIGRRKIDAVKLAQYLMTMYIVDTMERKDDCGYNLIESIHNSLYEVSNGKFQTKFDRNVWYAIKTFFSKNGNINWIDNTYTPKTEDQNGQCCKLRFSKELSTFLNQTRERGILCSTSETENDIELPFHGSCEHNIAVLVMAPAFTTIKFADYVKLNRVMDEMYCAA